MLSLEVDSAASLRNRDSSEKIHPVSAYGRALSLGMDFGMVARNAEDMYVRRPYPVQLDLLPLGPACAQQQAGAVSQSSINPLGSSVSQITRQSLFGASRMNSENDHEEIVITDTRSSSLGASPSPRGLDMNEMPPSEYTDADVSSPNSILSPFNLDTGRKGENSVNMKREREKMLDFDADRACEATSRASDEEDGMPRKKLRLTKEQSALLEESFKEHSTLNPKQKNALAKQLNLKPRQVEVWFQNRRARTKLKQTEIDCELLKRCCESLTEENRRLQKELQELRAIKVPPPCVIAQDFFMPLPAATLTMCPSCERLATVDNRTLAFSKQGFAHYPQQPPATCQS